MHSKPKLSMFCGLSQNSRTVWPTKSLMPPLSFSDNLLQYAYIICQKNADCFEILGSEQNMLNFILGCSSLLRRIHCHICHKEAIHIKHKVSDLNKDKGRHQLPSVYDSVISSDQSTTSGQITQSPANSSTNISRHWRWLDANRRPPNVQN